MDAGFLAVHGHAAAGLSAETVVWLAAIIGAAGSVVGGFVGGFVALLGARKQAQRDREDARADRSHQAAMSIAGGMASVVVAIVVWKEAAEQAARAGAVDVGNVQRGAAIGQSMTDVTRATAGMRAAATEFGQVAAVQGLALTDGDLASRVVSHIRLVAFLCRFAEQSGTAGPQLSDTVQRHAQAVVDAIEAHVNGRPLPGYAPLPPLEVSRAQEIVGWKERPDAEAG